MASQKTSRPTWLDLLQKNLQRLLNEDPLARVAILGIGNELRGDDGIGPAAVRALQKTLAGRENILLVDTGPAPENFTGAVRRFSPRLVLLIDAAGLDGAPGEIYWIDPGKTGGFSASSHTLPLGMLVQYLSSELDCEVYVIGIQPRNTSLGEGLSEEVCLSGESIVAAVSGLFLPWSSSDNHNFFCEIFHP